MSAGLDSRFVRNQDTPAQVLVCFAVREEALSFTAPINPVTDILLTGIGRQKASQTVTRYLASHKPGLVLTCGFAGGLKPGHELGRVLFDDSEGGPFRARFTSHGAQPGRFVHSDRVLTTAREKARLFESTGGDAVEMESSAVAAACRERGLPIIIARAISDTAEEDLPMDFNRFSRADGSLSMPRLLLGIARSPSAIPELITFQSRLRQAARRLAESLQHFLASDGLF